MQLHNKFNKKELKDKLAHSHVHRTNISFYKYFRIENPTIFRDSMYVKLNNIGVLGRIYVAREGVNAQISIPDENLIQLASTLEQIDSRLANIRLNVAVQNEYNAFVVLKIKVRDKIVADGLNDETFDPSNVGQYLKADTFNEIIESRNTILVDMRNHYESEVGHFKNAITPDVDTFRDSLPIIDDMLKGNESKNLVMYCTGGIRCEKASAWFKHQGYKNVYHLEGGIIKYANDVKKMGLPNKFIGKNFVFDDRLGERISDDIIATCHQCGEPADTHTNCANEACHLLFIQCDKCKEQFNGCCSEECKHVICLPLEQQKELRKGIKNGQMIFKKGRAAHLRTK